MIATTLTIFDAADVQLASLQFPLHYPSLHPPTPTSIHFRLLLPELLLLPGKFALVFHDVSGQLIDLLYKLPHQKQFHRVYSTHCVFG